jgi:hypothetical protein
VNWYVGAKIAEKTQIKALVEERTDVNSLPVYDSYYLRRVPLPLDMFCIGAFTVLQYVRERAYGAIPLLNDFQGKEGPGKYL